ncbi:mechanosensitive ion channel family protein [Haloplanus rubicundus]|uniref:Mechanosensitive ion channel family protein n=1 Tax=Haloplanus rubicundus TaxID=1547898 RepID=A0A345EGT9_9EURY|nr:mechanosensitive ion channel domain-containing protein [Haloplanus rubicundus]AXG11411.1 mechanosensitive ion channel family protein [Haloplanus rubicundus]
MLQVALQTATPTPVPTPVVGPEGLAAYWALIRRAVWFVAGFVAVVLVGWFAVEPLVARFVRRRNSNNPTIQEAVSRYVRLLVLVVAFFVAAGTAGYGRFIGDSALVIAAGTLAVGVAGQTVIGSIVSGLVLVVDPEFNVGNYIEWADREGTVQSITLRVTRILTPDGELVTVPNTLLTGQAITRPYGRGRRRIVEHVGVAYEADVAAALDHLTAATEAVDDIVAEPTPKAYVDDFGSDSVVLRVHYWIEDPRRRDIFAVRSAYARAAKERLEAAGITISPASKRELQGRIGVDGAADGTAGGETDGRAD